MVANHRVSTQNCGIGIKDDVIFDGWVPFTIADDLPLFVFWTTQGTQGYSLVNLDPHANV